MSRPGTSSEQKPSSSSSSCPSCIVTSPPTQSCSIVITQASEIAGQSDATASFSKDNSGQLPAVGSSPAFGSYEAPEAFLQLPKVSLLGESCGSLFDGPAWSSDSSNDTPGVSKQSSGPLSGYGPRKNKNQSSLEGSHEQRSAPFCQASEGETCPGQSQLPHRSQAQRSEEDNSNSKTTLSPSRETLQAFSVQPTLEDLPEEVLLNIVRRLPTVSLIACAAAHETFASVINDVQFLNWHTRVLLGFPASQKDITYDIIPAPVAPLQDLWFQVYLHRAAPKMVGLVRPGVIFYDLLCFKHLLDTWTLQGLGYKYWMFVSDVLKSPKSPPLPFLKCKRLMTISTRMLRMLTKVALCSPEILLFTVNDFEELSVSNSPPSDLDDAWEVSVPVEWKLECNPQHTCEVVSRQRGLALASFFFTFDSNSCIGWCGVIDYSTFRWKDTWGQCKFSPDETVNNIKCYCSDLFHTFIEYTGREYISVHCPNAFLFRGLGKLIMQREHLLPKLQGALEKTALSVTRKVKKALSPEECRDLKVFMDGVQCMDSSQGPAASSTGFRGRAQPRESSKTLEVAVQRYLHRYLNRMIGEQVLRLYADPTCHHVLCITCRNTHTINATPFCVCMERVGPQRLPLNIWPPHLLQQAVLTLPALAKFVRLDVELWKRGLLGGPLAGKVELFVRQVLSVVYLDVNVDPGATGVIARRFSA